MEAVFGCSSPSDCQEDRVHSVAITKNSDIFLSNSAEAKRKLQVGCSYSLYNHVQELQKKKGRQSLKQPRVLQMLQNYSAKGEQSEMPYL